MFHRTLTLALTIALAPIALPATPAAPAAPHTFAIGEKDFLLDGQRIQIRCGEMHFARVPREYWQQRLHSLKAMGFNAVCAYLFWNYHEWNEGVFDWSGQRDAAEFCRLAQQEGLWVILRPGPYVCAEWEMGGLPWWLLNKNPRNDFLRTRDPAFMKPARRWLAEVGRVLGPLQITRGGPIIMVQVENEYGSYGKDADYMRDLRQTLLDAGFNVTLFACNPTGAVVRSHIPELFSVANFGKDPASGFAALAKLEQKGPPMCGEFYPGWFDIWGGAHHYGNTKQILADLDYMLAHNGSFSLYMAHGGSTFGLWAGANRPFRPDTSSYDYDAPISEAGWTTEKFTLIRDLMAKHRLPNEAPFPTPPPNNPVIKIPAFTLRETAPVLDNIPATTPVIREKTPTNIEAHNISRGLVSYRATLPPGPAGTLKAAGVRDLAWVFIQGNPRPLGIMDSRNHRFQVDIPARDKPVTIEILVYTIARVNFGVEIHDRKGLRAPVTFLPRGSTTTPQEITDWEIRAIDFGADAQLPALAWKPATPATARPPPFWRGTFNIDTPADTFLDMTHWGFGIVWVNGRALGRYWNIGPTQTMYLPAPWLKPGANEIVVLDLTGPDKPEIAGLATPILDRLRPEKDFAPRNSQSNKLNLANRSPAQTGEFAPGPMPQEIRFPKPLHARQICIEALDTHGGDSQAAIAELELLGPDNRPLNQSAWTIAYTDSEETSGEDGSALNAINGQPSDSWLTAKSARAPHFLIIDLGKPEPIAALRYTPRQGDDKTPGRIKTYRIYAGDDLVLPTTRH